MVSNFGTVVMTFRINAVCQTDDLWTCSSSDSSPLSRVYLSISCTSLSDKGDYVLHDLLFLMVRMPPNAVLFLGTKLRIITRSVFTAIGFRRLLDDSRTCLVSNQTLMTSQFGNPVMRVWWLSNTLEGTYALQDFSGRGNISCPLLSLRPLRQRVVPSLSASYHHISMGCPPYYNKSSVIA